MANEPADQPRIRQVPGCEGSTARIELGKTFAGWVLVLILWSLVLIIHRVICCESTAHQKFGWKTPLSIRRESNTQSEIMASSSYHYTNNPRTLEPQGPPRKADDPGCLSNCGATRRKHRRDNNSNARIYHTHHHAMQSSPHWGIYLGVCLNLREIPKKKKKEEKILHARGCVGGLSISLCQMHILMPCPLDLQQLMADSKQNYRGVSFR